MSTHPKKSMSPKATAEQVKGQLAALLEDIKEHQVNMTSALDAITQAMKGDAAVLHVENMRKALASFPGARKAVETSKRMLKERVMERLKD